MTAKKLLYWASLPLIAAPFAMPACSGSSPSSSPTCSATGGACPDGQSIEVCATKGSDGSCSGAYYKVGTQTFQCNSCADVQSCSTAAAQACLGDAGGSGSSGGSSGSSSSGSGSNGGSGGTVHCTTMPCSNGADAQVCEVIGAAGTCTSAYVTVGSQTFSCASCTDLTSCATSGAAACSSGSSSGGSSGSGSTSSSGSSSGGTDAGACGSIPTLHPEAAGVYCPFTSAGNVRCPVGQQCCEPPQGSGAASTCQTGGTCPVTGSATWECEDAADCAGNPVGTVCCGVGAVQFDSTCGFYRGSGFQGAQCGAGCTSSQVILCGSTSECTAAGSAGTCTAFKTDGLDLGACQ